MAIIYREDLNITRNKDIDSTSDETLWVTVKIFGSSLLLGVVYRPQYLNIYKGDGLRAGMCAGLWAGRWAGQWAGLWAW